MSETELKPCPFCSGEADMVRGDEYHKAYCTRCQNRTCEHPRKKDAVAAWNTRADQPRPATADPFPLPVITDELWREFGETQLMTWDRQNNRPHWTQDAVDFAAMLSSQLRPAVPEDWLQWIEDACVDLCCINVPTGGDDYDVHWQVIEHYMAQPHERVIGYGQTPEEALRAAQQPEGGE